MFTCRLDRRLFYLAATPAHLSSRVFFLPLHGLSLTLPKEKSRLSRSRNICCYLWWSLIKCFLECSYNNLCHEFQQLI
ncbi:hypothetical protein C0J52_07187 [Blattella germanica]|nr:hypothetical protein C0J52_07187 [Blattella germanica]